MIAKATSTGSLGGHYLEHGDPVRADDGSRFYRDKEERVRFQEGINLAADPSDRDAVRKEMEATAAKNPRVQNTYHKTSLALHPSEGEKTPEEWRDIVADYAEKMEYGDRQIWITGHKDEPQDHVHLVVNRVDSEGRCWGDYQDWDRAEDAAREIEHKHDLYRVQGTKGKYRDGQAPTDDPDQLRDGPPTRGEGIPDDAIKMHERTGEIPFAAKVNARRDEIREDLRESTSIKDANERLSRHGMEIRERGGGYVVADRDAPEGTNRAKAASSIDRESSAPKLKSRWKNERQRARRNQSRSRQAARGR